MYKIFIFLLIPVILTGCFNMSTQEMEDAGDILQYIPPAAAYATTLYLGDSEGRVQFYPSALTSLAVTAVLKEAVPKKRPNGGKHSFPSGHTSIAFQGAGFIHKRYGLGYAIPAYAIASFVGYSRIKGKKHYVEDVVAGAAIGVVSSFIFTTPYHGVSVTPYVKEGAYGISINKDW